MSNKQDLIYEDGKLKDCIENRVALGYWKSLWHFHGYVKDFKHIKWTSISENTRDFIKHLKGMIEAIAMLSAFLLLPFFPFLKCFAEQHYAKKRNERIEKLFSLTSDKNDQ